MASLFLLLSLPKVSRATNFPALGTAERWREGGRRRERGPLCNEEHVLRMNLSNRANEGRFSFEREREMKKKATARILSPFHCGGAENEVVVGGGISKTPDDE